MTLHWKDLGSVVVSTLDAKSGDPGSNPGRGKTFACVKSLTTLTSNPILTCGQFRDQIWSRKA